MWAKVNILLVISILGLFLAPSLGFACHSLPEKPKQEQKSCCSEKSQDVKESEQVRDLKHIEKAQEPNPTGKTQDVKDRASKDCCKDKKQDSGSSGDQADDCGKHCAEKSCRTSMQCNPLISFEEADSILMSDNDQLKLYTLYKQPFCPDAYFSIWQPPKLV
ncbi:MAG: hypothetical protein K0R59_1757 [Sphingobacterium sp.]|jgi:hypothetical protein|uniref:hypothetical protein n=1 Tax=unclassified Sphingobacterium TaxID=2609468 RepID=UPI000985B148|nr:hypothetical protein [Sphingobacterium sp. CZ-UAM]MDF2516461.1 hypothetical protein [Sphingobacterium sp.]OOG15942.1 hypothetical protein BWD42_22750 [Sphingobacterium sp. CZ-UAM]